MYSEMETHTEDNTA